MNTASASPDPSTSSWEVTPAVGDLDIDLFAEGTHRYLHRQFGAQPGTGGTRFAVWAPALAAVR